MTSEPDAIEKMVSDRVAQRLAQAEEQKWVGVVNAAVEAINHHIIADAAHPRLLALVERSVAATERMEQMMVSSAPEDVKRYLPTLIEREKRADDDRRQHAADMRKMYRKITWAVPVATVFLAILDVILRVVGR